MDQDTALQFLTVHSQNDIHASVPGATYRRESQTSFGYNPSYRWSQ